MKSAVHHFDDKLLELAYGELPRHEAEAVEAHVSHCERCAASLAELRAVRATMSHLPMEAAPEAGLESLLAYAEQTAKHNAQGREQHPWWRRYLLPLASAATLTVVGVVAWRASQEFNPQAGQLALQMQRERATKEEAPAVAKAAPPPPQAAQKEVQPEPRRANAAYFPADDAPALPQQAELDKRSEDELSSFAYTGDRKPTPQKNRAEAKEEVVGGLATALAGKGVQATPPSAQRQDYSNARARGAQLNDGAGVAQALEGNAAGGSLRPGIGEGAAQQAGPALGLSGGQTDTGTARSPAPAPKLATRDELQPMAEKKKASRPPPAEAAPSAPEPAGSLSLGFGSKDRSPSSGSGGKAEVARGSWSSSTASDLETRLQQARSAALHGDHPTEIKLCLEVLNSKAEASQRLEALKRLCDAWEQLGEPDRAQPYCDTLVREFGSSAAAQAVVDRRIRSQRLAPEPAKASSKPAKRPASKPAQ